MDSDTRRRYGLSALLAGAGVTHLVAPGPYRRIIPPGLGDPDPWVRWSGVVEIGCAALLASARTSRTGGWAAAALFVAVFPANVYTVAITGDSRWKRRAALARLPLQVPLVVAALRTANAPGRPSLPSRR